MDDDSGSTGPSSHASAHTCIPLPLLEDDVTAEPPADEAVNPVPSTTRDVKPSLSLGLAAGVTTSSVSHTQHLHVRYLLYYLNRTELVPRPCTFVMLYGTCAPCCIQVPPLSPPPPNRPTVTVARCTPTGDKGPYSVYVSSLPPRASEVSSRTRTGKDSGW